MAVVIIFNSSTGPRYGADARWNFHDRIIWNPTGFVFDL